MYAQYKILIIISMVIMFVSLLMLTYELFVYPYSIPYYGGSEKILLGPNMPNYTFPLEIRSRTIVSVKANTTILLIVDYSLVGMGKDFMFLVEPGTHIIHVNVIERINTNIECLFAFQQEPRILNVTYSLLLFILGLAVFTYSRLKLKK